MLSRLDHAFRRIPTSTLVGTPYPVQLLLDTCLEYLHPLSAFLTPVEEVSWRS